MKKTVLAACAVFATLLIAPAAQASACDDVLEQPFLDFGDQGLYSLVPGGDFESPGAWELDGEATLLDGSLALPSRSVATSPSICVTADHTHLRMFGRSLDGGEKGRLRVKVLYGHDEDEQTASKLDTTGSWAPLDQLDLDEELFELDPQTGTGQIKLRFRVNGSERHGVAVDSVYVDPRSRS